MTLREMDKRARKFLAMIGRTIRKVKKMLMSSLEYESVRRVVTMAAKGHQAKVRI